MISTLVRLNIANALHSKDVIKFMKTWRYVWCSLKFEKISITSKQ